MKELKKIAILSILLICTPLIAKAIQPVSINEPQLVNENTATQVQQSGGPGGALFYDKMEALGKRYDEDLRNCVPFHFNQYLDIFGLKVKFDIDINGWIDNKCEYKISGKVNSIGKDIREVFEIKASDEQIAKFQPLIECHFTKTQLGILVDAMSARNKQTEQTLSKMLESPDKKLKNSTPPKKQMTPEEEKLMMLLMTDNVCTIPNKEDLMKQIEGFSKPTENL